MHLSPHRRATAGGQVLFYPIGVTGSQTQAEYGSMNLYTIKTIHGILDLDVRP